MRKPNRSARRRDARVPRRDRARVPLTAALESLERRSMLAANVLDVTKVLWGGNQVDAVRNEYILRMPQTNAATAKSPLDYACATPTVQAGWSVQGLGSGFFRLTAPGASQSTVTAWASRSGVRSIDVNRVAKASAVPNDPLYADANNWAFPRINTAGAWDTGTGTSSTIVAVLDSGVDYNHPDLAANMWRNPNEIAGDGIDNDNNGYVDDIFGINAIAGTTNPMDDFGHGTVIAGLVGAVGNNAAGMAGVNWACKIMAVKVMDAAGNVPLNAEITGINYVLRQKLAGQSVAVANCSFGRYAFNQQEFDALNQLALTGVTIVAAAGNDSNNNDQQPMFPANYDISGLISVAASDQVDNLAGFSNFGRTTVDLAAPGVGILSTRAAQASEDLYPIYLNNYTITSTGRIPPDFTQNQAFVDGTSCSAALVSGTAALLKSLKPGASAVQIRNAILNGADRVAALNGLVFTGARLNVKNAVDLILATTGAVPDATFVIGQNLRYLEGNVGYAMAEVKVQLDRPNDPGKSCSVYYTTQPGGSAFANVDYVATSGYLTFSGSETQKSFYVKLIGDRLAEQAEQFAVQIIAAQSRGVTTGGGALQQVNVIILDDDNTNAPVQPGPTNPGLLPQVSVDVKRDASNVAIPIREGGLATFVVSLDKTSPVPVSVKYRTNQPSLVPVNTALEGVDYVATSGTMTFKPGERTKEFTVRILADRVNDQNETFRVVLTEPLNADLAPAAGGGGPGGVNTSGAVTATIADVPYLPPPQSGFQITVTFPDNTLTSGQQAVFQQAAARWSQIITGDLPDVVDPATGQKIDDLWIVATAPALDGAGGILGQATPTELRPGAKGLPWKGIMEFDSADVAALVAEGSFTNVILHEMGHVLGIGSLWRDFGLVVGAGTPDPQFVGVNALREYRSIFGLPTARGVPVENQFGPGAADVHWRESVLQTEMMTSIAEFAGVPMPISRITVGSLQDLGYTVNYAKADAYTKPAALVAPAPARPGAPVPPAGNRRLLLTAATPAAQPSRDAAAVATSFAQMAAEQGGGRMTVRPTVRPARPTGGSVQPGGFAGISVGSPFGS